MPKIINVVLSIVLSSVMASCISVHKKETKEVPETTVHHDTVVVP